MYAQLIHGGATPELRSELDRLVADDLIPALGEEPGFGGALSLVDRRTGEGMTIVLWETAEQARRPLSQYGRAFRDAVGRIAAVSSGLRQALPLWSVTARV